ncbi:hypothetical protein ACIG0C_02270 [Kitasatospora aureofaciens]|uniref:Uncharacterized protein n=1 Tax=Kitasatospora aureofaciens TaxID=1894 RepID=A0A1E7N3E6_KITAU|nr:hypothetical protein [Kitasatospora aureofaciens]ARF79292.1 hypothetical protein B6264_10525 [Kitasatospora aureofaciens]OEV35229.1 hypothetical protein HS99_0033490 [Kitasatospora aureofaciens]GGU67490.1 hypothetical protein GCM10010502_18330 [Kitasatospora aureofaciens]
MSNEDMAGAEAAASYGLSEVAESIEIGAVPYDRLLAGGRRRLRRRRLLTGGAGAVLVVAVAGAGTAIGGYGREAGGASVAAVSSAAALVPGRSSVSGTPSASAFPSPVASPSPVVAPAATATPAAIPTVTPTASAASSRTPRDPFTPVRAKIGEGAVNGHTMEVWVALWPAARTAEDGLKQGELIWTERRAADPTLPADPAESGNPVWDLQADRVDVYLVADGKRQPGDFVDATTAPGGTAKDDTGPTKGVMLNRVTGEASRPDMVAVSVGPEVARVVVSWKTGGSVAAVPVAVGDSPVHWYAVVRRLGSTGNTGNTATSFAADGSVLGVRNTWW